MQSNRWALKLMLLLLLLLCSEDPTALRNTLQEEQAKDSSKEEEKEAEDPGQHLCDVQSLQGEFACGLTRFLLLLLLVCCSEASMEMSDDDAAVRTAPNSGHGDRRSSGPPSLNTPSVASRGTGSISEASSEGQTLHPSRVVVLVLRLTCDFSVLPSASVTHDSPGSRPQHSVAVFEPEETQLEVSPSRNRRETMRKAMQLHPCS